MKRGTWAWLPLALAGAWAAAQELPEYDALRDIADHMHSAASLLAQTTTGPPTQDVQKEVVRKLDVLIAELEKECENCRGGAAGANPTRPLGDSVVKSGPGGSGELHGARKDGKQWGELPPHERDRILQSLSDGFPPHYQRILERYYRRLADEKPAGEPGDAAPPKKEKVPAKSADSPAAKSPSASRAAQRAVR